MNDREPLRKARVADGQPQHGLLELVTSAIGLRIWKSVAGGLGTAIAAAKADGRRAPASERTADRKLNNQAAMARDTVLAVFSFAVAAAAGAGFLIVYWTSASHWMLGGTLALFLGGIGCSLVLYSHGLIAERQAVEAREQLQSNAQECERTREDFCAGASDVSRRGLLGAVGLVAAGFASAILVSLCRSFGAAPGPTLFSTVWKRGQRLATPDGAPVSMNALEQGEMMIVFPENSVGDERAQTVLIRVNQDELKLPDGRGNWAPMGYVAYSRVCTHAGCPVGMFEKTTGLLMCPCHQSTFDVLRGAIPTDGPAVRPLPQLPLYADANGVLHAGGGFSEPPGPGFWWLT